MTDRIQIDYKKVYAGLPEIMGMPMRFERGRWYASRKMDGAYSTRQDKLVCTLKKERTAGPSDWYIEILEQGGGITTLFQWMQKYGGCSNGREAALRLMERSAGCIALPDPEEEAMEVKYVRDWSIGKSLENRLHQPDALTLFLRNTFGPNATEMTLRAYKVGMGRRQIDGQFRSMTQFWYIDESGNIMHDKLMLYKEDGHRDKDVNPRRQFTKQKGYTGRCLFGQHLLKGHSGNARVYVVESEKTAIICSIFFGQGIWLASGGKAWLKSVGVREGWRVLPDVDAYDDWAQEFGSACVKWWEKYDGYQPGPKDDIGDLVLSHLMKK